MAELAEHQPSMPGPADREAGGGVFPKEFAEAYRDMDFPDVREVSSRVKGDAKGG
jgi:hypothetical protein